MIEIINDIIEERERQDKKWGANRDLPHTFWLTILAEESGEAAKAILQGTPNLKDELIQVAAVAVAWIENIESQRRQDERNYDL